MFSKNYINFYCNLNSFNFILAIVLRLNNLVNDCIVNKLIQRLITHLKIINHNTRILK